MIMDLDIFTVTTGREFYLRRMLPIIYRNRSWFRKHILVLNGCDLSPDMQAALDTDITHVYKLDKLISIGEAINAVLPMLSAKYTMKFDDDAVPVGENFFCHLAAVVSIVPDRVISPFPVGLINSVGGPSLKEGRKHEVLYSDATDTYYALRPVNHVGGFSRISPREYYSYVNFQPHAHIEDMEFSNAMKSRGIEMCYVENALIVEHAETTLGQIKRNPEYHKRRVQVAAQRKKMKDNAPRN